MSGASKPAQRLEWIDKGRRPGLVMVEHIVAGARPPTPIRRISSGEHKKKSGRNRSFVAVSAGPRPHRVISSDTDGWENCRLGPK